MPVVMTFTSTRGLYASVEAFRRVINAEYKNHIGPELARDCTNVVSHWKKRPDFEVEYQTSQVSVWVDVIPTGPVAKLWWWHVRGVEGRTIRPRIHRQPPNRMLSRKRRRTASRATLRFMGREGRHVYRRKVFWKGIRPKPYPQMAADAYRPTFLRRNENALRRAVRAAQKEGT